MVKMVMLGESVNFQAFAFLFSKSITMGNGYVLT